ncbi:MAG: phosphatase PAP2 family protein [Alphaproteobacteria bacterium]|nr:phosphatase PAP2 family protein [Alphaproteobacteria bacterium]
MSAFISIFIILLFLPVAFPALDLSLSGFFYESGKGFPLAGNDLFKGLHLLASDGARVLGALLAIFFLIAVAAKAAKIKAPRKFRVFLSVKSQAFLLLALILGPGLIANAGFKDHWGRARPREIVEFGGKDTFTAALSPRFEKARSNGSFVCGDGAFGFFLPSFAYVVPRRRKRFVFWAGMAGGVVFSFIRLAAGAHFFSDIVYAAATMLGSGAGLYAVLFGMRKTRENWTAFLKTSFHAAKGLDARKGVGVRMSR